MEQLKIKGSLCATNWDFGFSFSEQWSLAELDCSVNSLEISGDFEKYVFLKENIISIDLYKPKFSLNGTGIKINHSMNNYCKSIIFTTTELTPEVLIEKIKLIGFFDKNHIVDPVIIDKIKKDQKSIPLINKILVILIFLIIIIYILSK